MDRIIDRTTGLNLLEIRTTNVSIGRNAGIQNQSSTAIAVGQNAGQSSQQTSAIAIGLNAGQINQGQNCVAIGNNSGVNNQHNNSIVINASATPTASSTTNSCYINPIANCTSGYVMGYNRLTKEVANFSYAKNYSFQVTTSTLIFTPTQVDVSFIFSNFNVFKARIIQWVFPDGGAGNPDWGVFREVTLQCRRNPIFGTSGGYQAHVTAIDSTATSSPTLIAPVLGTLGSSLSLNLPFAGATLASSFYTIYCWIELISPTNQSLDQIIVSGTGVFVPPIVN